VRAKQREELRKRPGRVADGVNRQRERLSKPPDRTELRQSEGGTW
jgi:hypothetical protein